MIALLLALVFTAPYQDLTLPDGGSYSFTIDCGDPNAGLPVGEIQFHSYLDASGWFRYSYNSWNGWNGETQLDPMAVNVWAQPLTGKPFGNVDSLRRAWPAETGAITVRTNGSRVSATVYGSPCESVRLIGNDNVLTVYAVSGEQTLFKMGRPAVLVQGSRNRVSGYAEHPLCALYVRGNDTTVANFEAVGGSVGDDTGMLYFANDYKVNGVKQFGYYNGATLRNVTIRQSGRKYQPIHGTNGAYFDDGFSRISIDRLNVYGYFTRPWFANGGTGYTVKRLKVYP